MRTLIISDLHLGSRSGADVLRAPELRSPLLEAVADVDRLVLLGDVLELRHGPPREALLASRPLLEDLGRVLSGRELVLVAGNHDHALIEPWLARRTERDPAGPLGLEHELPLDEASPMLAQMADWAAPARVLVRYPGLWVRPDVYATHGHYLDCHITVPTIERLSLGAMSRLMSMPASAFSCADDYEAVMSPAFAWRDAVARNGRTGDALNGMLTVHAWNALAADAGPNQAGARRNGPAGARRSLAAGLRRRALVAAFPVAVAGLNRLGIGPLKADISARELRRAGLAAMAEVCSRLGLRGGHVVFGHTHRIGPLPRDREAEWRPAGAHGPRLVNSGGWTYSPMFLTATPGESAYWPGGCVLVEDSGPPLVQRLLADRSHAELSPERSPRRGPAGVRPAPA